MALSPNTAQEIAQFQRLSAFGDREYTLDAQAVVIGSAIQALLLLVILAISVIKPWGRSKMTTIISSRNGEG
ncbi:MAG: hypothetical protein QNJ72_36225 [Pleurocapsa sp. MO_226.B13]|nr:hypothetical protein [Pleurocapsa sp. MO_226.B13]